MQGQWHTPRPKVLAMPHRMLLEMDTTSGLHMLYKFVLKQFRNCLTQPGLRQPLRSLSYRESCTTLHKHGLYIIPDTSVL
jgi:hypothetical protein